MDPANYQAGTQSNAPKLLLFGGRGAIGSAVQRHFQRLGWQITVVTRAPASDRSEFTWDPLSSDNATNATALSGLSSLGPFDAVCWAQGANGTDSVYDFDSEKHMHLYRANVLYILESLQALLAHDLLQKPARLCIVSSIWQQLARQDKLSYCITKSALEGLVRAAAADLARDGHVINAVLPGVIDTPMAHKNLSVEQIQKIEGATLFNRLPALDEVAHCIYTMCQPGNTAVTGQFIAVDLGYSHVRIV